MNLTRRGFLTTGAACAAGAALLPGNAVADESKPEPAAARQTVGQAANLPRRLPIRRHN